MTQVNKRIGATFKWLKERKDRFESICSGGGGKVWLVFRIYPRGYIASHVWCRIPFASTIIESWYIEYNRIGYYIEWTHENVFYIKQSIFERLKCTCTEILNNSLIVYIISIIWDPSKFICFIQNAWNIDWRLETQLSTQILVLNTFIGLRTKHYWSFIK